MSFYYQTRILAFTPPRMTTADYVSYIKDEVAKCQNDDEKTIVMLGGANYLFEQITKNKTLLESIADCQAAVKLLSQAYAQFQLASNPQSPHRFLEVLDTNAKKALYQMIHDQQLQHSPQASTLKQTLHDFYENHPDPLLPGLKLGLISLIMFLGLD